MTTPQPNAQPAAIPVSGPKPVASPATSAGAGIVTKINLGSIRAKLAAKGASGIKIYGRDEISDALKRRVVGQDLACETIDELYAIGAARQSSQTPVCVVFLAGPPGTGKSFIVENLHRFVSGESDLTSMIFIDGGKLKNPELGMTQLFGAPKGYVGAEDGGQISRGLQNRANSIILIDEFEKAHPSIQQSLLVALNSGFCDDLYNKTKISTTKSAWFFTTNKNQKTLGPQVSAMADKWARSKVLRENYVASDFLSPEFADRVDIFLWLDRLKDDDQIVMIANVVQEAIHRFDSRMSLADRGIEDEVVIDLYNQLQNLSDGTRELARIVKRTVQRDLLDMKRDGLDATKLRIVMRDGAVRAIPADIPTAT